MIDSAEDGIESECIEIRSSRQQSTLIQLSWRLCVTLFTGPPTSTSRSSCSYQNNNTMTEDVGRRLSSMGITNAGSGGDLADTNVYYVTSKCLRGRRGLRDCGPDES
jgi:hypothetical protein